MSRLPRNVTAQELEKALLTLGFEERRVRGSHLFFRHKETGAVIALPISGKYLRMAHLALVRRVLVENSIVFEEEFNDLFR